MFSCYALAFLLVIGQGYDIVILQSKGENQDFFNASSTILSGESEYLSTTLKSNEEMEISSPSSTLSNRLTPITENPDEAKQTKNSRNLVSINVEFTNQDNVLTQNIYSSIVVYVCSDINDCDDLIVKLSSSPYDFYGEKSKKVTSGYAVFSIMFKEVGSVTVTAEVGKKTNSKLFIIKPFLLVFESPFNEKTNFLSKDEIKISVEVADTYGNYKQDSNFKYTIELKLLCYKEPCSGNKTLGTLVKKTYQNKAQFDISVKSSGIFFFKAICKKYNVLGYSKQFHVENQLKSLNAKISTLTESTTFPIYIDITLIGEDDELYLNQTLVEIKEKHKKIKGDTTNLNANGKIHARIYFLNKGNYTFDIVCGIFIKKIENVIIKPGYLEVQKYTNNDINSNNGLEFILKLYDNEKKNRLQYKIPIQFKIILSHSSNVNAKSKTYYVENKNIYTESNFGTVHVKNFYIVKGNTYEITFEAGDMKAKIPREYDIVRPGCKPGSGPISSYCVLIVLCIGFSLLFYYTDRKVRTFKTMRYPIMLIHPLTSFFFKQPDLRRTLLCIQVFSSELLIISIIGAVYHVFDTPETMYEEKMSDYNEKEIYKGAMGWGISQIFIIPIFFLNWRYINNRKVVKSSIGICAVVIISCFGGVSYMTYKYCIGFSYFWAANFMIFWVFDLVTAQIIYTIICYNLWESAIKIGLRTGNFTRQIDVDIRHCGDNNIIKNENQHKEDQDNTSRQSAKANDIYEIKKITGNLEEENLNPNDIDIRMSDKNIIDEEPKGYQNNTFLEEKNRLLEVNNESSLAVINIQEKNENLMRERENNECKIYNPDLPAENYKAQEKEQQAAIELNMK
ncbi:hypothetical protein SteCoe_3658 [Stentor coeruleus]|uniref:Intimal thickness related receptor IRP domain-containing protein n=1 Tax=Stentor coeruleus TaxID=5963 RepID=A0A1R2CWN5_9CILI|nr:hypothetical protein SteCoe_3658 [Stentor coeruleus]